LWSFNFDENDSVDLRHPQKRMWCFSPQGVLNLNGRELLFGEAAGTELGDDRNEIHYSCAHHPPSGTIVDAHDVQVNRPRLYSLFNFPFHASH
jgi:hypothetical protein